DRRGRDRDGWELDARKHTRDEHVVGDGERTPGRHLHRYRVVAGGGVGDGEPGGAGRDGRPGGPAHGHPQGGQRERADGPDGHVGERQQRGGDGERRWARDRGRGGLGGDHGDERGQERHGHAHGDDARREYDS